MVLPTFTSAAPAVHATLPPASLWKFSSSSFPATLTPPDSDFTLARPFNINSDFYNSSLHFAVPLTIALVYGTTVTYVNRLNKERDYKPWAFSKSTAFYLLVVAHNISLAIYSGWTFIGMLNAIKESWPGWNGPYGLAGVADALCKINGPRGLGNAATYNAYSSGWHYTNKAIQLVGGNPDSTDVGRIWNEGLAYYGYLFYLSKFYEVLDSAIVLAKGKRSGTLQTFHHAGVMMCMWSGIRYMSPPIWMFVFINAGIHTIMYSYYTLCALTIQVPPRWKRILTILQIIQIVFGTSYALAHLFVAYDIPIEISYTYTHNLSTALPSAVSTVSSAVSSAFVSATASAGVAHWLKKAALRAAGEEGLAENVRNYQGETFGIDAIHAANVEKAQTETRYRMGTQKVHCLDSPGQVFAILLNALYLVPLAVLFFRFFYKSYIQRAQSEPPKPTTQENIKQSSKDAEKKVEKQIEDAMFETQGGITEPPPELKEKLEKAKKDAKKTASDATDQAKEQAKDLSAKAQKGANDLSDKAKDVAGDLPAKAQKTAQDLNNKAKDAAGDLPAKAQKGAQDLANKAKDASGDIPAKAQEMGAQAKKAGKDVSKTVQEDLQALQEKMKKMGGEGQKSKPSKEITKPDVPKRDPSPDKPSSSSSTKAPRDKSPEKKPLIHGEDAAKRPSSRDKSPTKSSVTPKDQSPAKASSSKGGADPEDPKRSPKKLGPKKSSSSVGNDNPSSDLGASGYEIVPDEPKTEEMRRAEAEMQPGEG